MAVTHGLWVSRKTFGAIDGRRRIAKAFRQLRAELANAIGGDPSPQQGLLIDRAVFLIYRIKTFETMLIDGQTPKDEQEGFYNAWVHRLQTILQALGLKRVPRPAEGTILEAMLDGDR